MTDSFSLNKQTGDIVDREGNVIFQGYRSVSDCVEGDVDISELSGRCVECPEGNILRVFNYDGKWYVSTNRKLDAFTSRFLSKKETFGEAFERVLKDKYDMSIGDSDFDRSKKYVLLLKPSEHERVVCDVDEDIVFISCDGDHDSKEMPMFPRRKETRDFPAHNIAQGLFFVDEKIRVFSREYARRKAVCGNTPSLRFRYLELRSGNPKDIELFFSIHPSMRHIAEIIEEQIYAITKHLHLLYMQIFVKNDMAVMCTKVEKTVLNAIHKMYMITKQRTIPSRINDLLAQIPPTRLNRLLRETFVTQIEKKETE